MLKQILASLFETYELGRILQFLSSIFAQPQRLAQSWTRDEAHHHGDGEHAGSNEQGEDEHERGGNDDLDGWNILQQIELSAAHIATRSRCTVSRAGDAGKDE